MTFIAAQASTLKGCGRHVLNCDDWLSIQHALKLSERELEITQHIFDDNKAECIAYELGISVHTVNTYLQRLYTKLNVRSRSQLTLRVFTCHLEHLRTGRCIRTDLHDEQRPHVVRITDNRIHGL